MRTLGASGLFIYAIWKQCIGCACVSKLLNHHGVLDKCSAGAIIQKVVFFRFLIVAEPAEAREECTRGETTGSSHSTSAG